jgi:hypothetical protein
VGARLPGLPLRQSRFGPSPFLLHRLAVNEFYLTAKYRPLPRPDMRLARWISFREPLTPALPLTPDGYFEVVAGGTARAMFLEADLGSESSLVWQKKAQLYVQMAVRCLQRSVPAAAVPCFGHRHDRPTAGPHQGRSREVHGQDFLALNL